MGTERRRNSPRIHRQLDKSVDETHPSVSASNVALRCVALRSACILNNQGSSAPLLSIHPSALPQWDGILRRNHSPSHNMCWCSASQAPPSGMTSLKVDENAARPIAGRQLPPYFSRPKRSFWLSSNGVEGRKTNWRRRLEVAKCAGR